ncbi:hypothetical protein [Kribbella pratensis]|uniref:hypothetical protein n=1 Tax=Kribbella pratensis TaxID=2512112 RepID=UPI001065105B|nr:hypothetical protein [Kribbella pratensis]
MWESGKPDCSWAATLAAAEQHFYPRSRVDAVLIPHAGHVTNLHRNADAAYPCITAWADHTVEAGKKPQLGS